MTVIVWDGKTVAADRRGCINDAAMTMTKVWLITDGAVVATTGDAGFGMALVQWWTEGADPAKWPAFQSTDDWAKLIVFQPNYPPMCYERQPVPFPVEDQFMAWGSGREFALGALAMGATARQAVEVACRFNVYCGNVVDEFSVEFDA